MANRSYFIVGTGGHGREIREILKASGIGGIVYLTSIDQCEVTRRYVLRCTRKSSA